MLGISPGGVELRCQILGPRGELDLGDLRGVLGIGETCPEAGGLLLGRGPRLDGGRQPLLQLGGLRLRCALPGPAGLRRRRRLPDVGFRFVELGLEAVALVLDALQALGLGDGFGERVAEVGDVGRVRRTLTVEEVGGLRDPLVGRVAGRRPRPRPSRKASPPAPR